MRIASCIEALLICITITALIVGCDSSNVPATGAAGTVQSGPAPPPPPPPPPPPGSVESTNATSSDESRRVHNDFRRLSDAPRSGDWETFFQLMHPKVVESAGGRDALKKQTLIMPPDIKTEITFPSPPVFLKGTQNEFVVIPWKMVLTRNGKTAEATGAELGIRRIGETKWGYMEGSNQDRAELTASFPDFPADYQFPKSSKKPFTAD